ncbi:hypothetical protein CLOSTMETH_02508 [[Clostridium] methylpentosum DSM 5476]|uniref:Uncharacterized protein n=1 Tax=[Clostridium] methylpentosum DSM 5476 TaxID=537013 RepID=C0EF67_9FIRM|nr:hypothetical protein CLOSTMETH_02508 [[Clostridium] methylpentosum DSM 5476]
MSHLATCESDESTADANFPAFVGKNWGGDTPYSPKRQFCFTLESTFQSMESGFFLLTNALLSVILYI